MAAIKKLTLLYNIVRSKDVTKIFYIIKINTTGSGRKRT